MHMGLSNVLDHNWDVEIPCSYRLVIRCGDKPSVFVHKGDCVHRTKVLVIFLRDFTRIHVILFKQSNISVVLSANDNWTAAHLYDFLV
jgi:hypothetical protein